MTVEERIAMTIRRAPAGDDVQIADGNAGIAADHHTLHGSSPDGAGMVWRTVSPTVLSMLASAPRYWLPHGSPGAGGRTVRMTVAEGSITGRSSGSSPSFWQDGLLDVLGS